MIFSKFFSYKGRENRRNFRSIPNHILFLMYICALRDSFSQGCAPSNWFFFEWTLIANICREQLSETLSFNPIFYSIFLYYILNETKIML